MTLPKLSCRGRMNDAAYGVLVSMYEQRKNISEIAKKLNTSRATVRKWIDIGKPPSEAKERRKRSLVMQKRLKARRAIVVKLVSQQETVVHTRFTPVRKKRVDQKQTVRTFASAAAIARHVTAVHGITMSGRTAIRDLKAANFKLFSPGNGPEMLHEAHVRKRRVRFARSVLRMPARKRRSIMFSDEKVFDSQTVSRRKLWGRQAKDVPPGKSVQGGPKLMVLGFIARTSKRLIVLPEGTMNSEGYQKAIESYKAVIRRHLFQQDNARPHAKAMRGGWFGRRKIKLLGWPPYSPDLSPIETLWARVASLVAARGPFGPQELEQFVLEAWSEVKQSEVQRLLDTFEWRLRTCIEMEGGLVTKTRLRQHMAREKRRKAQRE